jgi:hypothetical protein
MSLSGSYRNLRERHHRLTVGIRVQRNWWNPNRFSHNSSPSFIGKVDRANIKSPIMSRSSRDASRVDVYGLRRGWIMYRYIGSAACGVWLTREHP